MPTHLLSSITFRYVKRNLNVPTWQQQCNNEQGTNRANTVQERKNPCVDARARPSNLLLTVLATPMYFPPLPPEIFLCLSLSLSVSLSLCFVLSKERKYNNTWKKKANNWLKKSSEKKKKIPHYPRQPRRVRANRRPMIERYMLSLYHEPALENPRDKGN